MSKIDGVVGVNSSVINLASPRALVGFQGRGFVDGV
jgi:hypothetical protein